MAYPPIERLIGQQRCGGRKHNVQSYDLVTCLKIYWLEFCSVRVLLVRFSEMASQTQGIQQLLAAEKRAAEKVSEARKRKYQLICNNNLFLLVSEPFGCNPSNFLILVFKTLTKAKFINNYILNMTNQRLLHSFLRKRQSFDIFSCNFLWPLTFLGSKPINKSVM